MLVLSRKTNQSIVINENIEVVVLKIEGNKVRLGFEAPQDVPIHRSEIEDKIKRQPPLSISLATFCAANTGPAQRSLPPR